MKKYTHILWDLDGTLIKSSNFSVKMKIARLFWLHLKKQESSFRKRSYIFYKMLTFFKLNSPGKTIEQKFLSRLIKVSGWSDKKAQNFIEQFYAVEFIKLAGEFDLIFDAFDFLNRTDHKYIHVLLTNPVLPLGAIQKKLEWAGININTFKWISHSQNCHYTKPDIRYFQECLNHVGTHAENCCLIGDDKKKDGSAAELGIDFYKVKTGDPLFWKQMEKQFLN